MQISHMQQLLRNREEPTRTALVVFLAAALLACERTTPVAGRKDTAVSIVPPPESSVVTKPTTPTWDTTAGPALFIAGPTQAQALVIIPRYTDSAPVDSLPFDSTILQSLQIELFGGGRRITSARIRNVVGGSRTDSCRTWPSARLDNIRADSSSTPSWSVAFEAGRAFGLPIDSIEGLASADSARLAADIARLASALPGDTTAIFRGLPFVVNKALRAEVPNGPTLLVAVVVRNVNQEANPRQERILLIAERDSSAASSRFTVRYTARTAGLEETLETTDPITIVLLGNERRPTVVTSRDAGKGLSYALIERVGGQWLRQWASAYAGC